MREQRAGDGDEEPAAAVEFRPRQPAAERSGNNGAVAQPMLTGAPENDLAAYLSLCESLQDGVRFTLSGPSGDQDGVTFDGRTAWHELAPGAYTATEAIPEGYGDPVVFCEGSAPGRQTVTRDRAITAGAVCL